MDAFQTILVAVDFSGPSDLAVERAIDLAKLTGARLHVVHAFELPMPLITPYEVAVPDPYLDDARKAAGSRLREVGERVRSAGLEVETHLLEIPAAPSIARAAEKLGAELIVLGTRGLTGVKHFVLGSVAERVMRLAPCSVLAIKAPDDA